MTELDRGLGDEGPAAVRAPVAGIRLADVRKARLVVTARLDTAQVAAVTVCARDELALLERFVGDHFDLHADRAERATAGAERLADLGLCCRSEGQSERRRQLLLVHAVVAADEGEHHPLACDHRHRLGGRRRIDLQQLSQILDRRHARCLHLFRRRQRRGELGRAGNAARGLDIRRVVAVLASNELVLARARRSEIVPRLPAAHNPGFGLHLVELEAATFEDPAVGLLMTLEALVQPGRVPVEGIRVLHDELAHAQQACAGTRLIPLLRAEVVPDLRQLLVRLQLPCVEGHRLFVRQREDEAPAGAVLQLEDLWNCDPPARLPELGGREHRTQHLLSADRVHLLADDLHDLLMHTPAQRQERPEPRADLADEAAAHQ